jgi:hypothetical protein
MSKIASFLTLTAGVPLLAAAHHSNAEYNFGAIDELEGEVVQFSWRNPHVTLMLQPTGDNVGAEPWYLEAQDINSLGRRGLDASMIHVGDTLRVAGHVSGRRERAMFVTNVLLPSGIEIRTRGETEPRWSNDNIGFARVDVDEIQSAADQQTGLFRVWMNRTASWFDDDALPLTPAARAVHSAWDPEDNLNRHCVAPGMPAAMRMPGVHPIDFIMRDSDIVIRNEMFDMERTIHMQPGDAQTMPAESALGYSVGRWDGDALVVETSRVNYQRFNYTGSIPQSEAVSITERFEVDASSDELIYDMTVTDPATFTEPVSRRWVLEWRPDLVVERYECTLGE